MNPNQVVNELIDLFTARVITGKDGELLYKTINLIHSLHDENVILKARLDSHSCLQGNH